MMKVSLLLEAVNRISGPVGVALQSIFKLGAGVAAATRSMERMGVASASMSRRVGIGMMGMYDTTRDAAHHFRRLAGDEGMARAARSSAYLRNQMSGLTNGISVLKYASVAAGIGLGEEFVRGVFRAGGEMERMLVSLTRIEGSAAKARQSMSWMQSFGIGAGANFSMPDIMKAYQQAKSFNMDPQGGSLTAFADFAALHNRSLYSVMYAVKDAMEGTSMRPLANLGIKGIQGKGPNALDTFLVPRPGGKGFERITSSKDPESILATIVRVMERQAGGLATAQAKTLPGGITQLKKDLYRFEGLVYNKGVGKWALDQVNAFFASLRKWQGDGSIEKLAKRISDFMTGTGDKIIGFVKSTDWKAVGADLKLLGASLGAVGFGLKALSFLGGGGLSSTR